MFFPQADKTDASRTQNISAQEVDEALQRPVFRLSFPRKIESQFEADSNRDRCRYLQICAVAGLAIYDLFLFSDAYLVPDLLRVAALIHLGIVTPLGLAMVAILGTNPSVRIRESMEVFLTALVTAGVVAVFLGSHSSYAQHYHYPVLVLILFANVVQRLRFPYACVASFLSLSIYVLAIGAAHNLPQPVAITAVMNLMATVFFGLFANFFLERDARKSYLLSLRDEIRASELLHAYQELHESSNRDPVTDLPNRRRMESFVAELPRKAADQYTSVLMIDVDHFKNYNDFYGHLPGDHCLRSLGLLADAQLRRGVDLIARFGGEEFLAVVPGADILDGIKTAERIRHAIECEAIAHVCSSTARVVTVSIGVASAKVTDCASFERLTAQADEELYQAKRHGRNRVWPAPCLPEPQMTDVDASESVQPVLI